MPAIVLNWSPVSNTSVRVSWFTRDAGRLNTLIKGAQRPKSWFRGQFDFFYTCDLVLYLHRRHTLHIARECAPLRTRMPLRQQWRSAAAAAYACDLITHSTALEQPDPALFHLLDCFLSLVERSDRVENLIYWFELKVLQEAGLAPRLQHCIHCGHGLARGREVRFSIDLGGLVCGQCRSGGHEPFAISLDAVGMLRAWQQSRRASAAAATRCNDRQRHEIRKLLDLFLRYHVDHPLLSRRIVFESLDRAA